MKVVIIEDEKLSADHLTILLNKIDTSIVVIECFDSIKSFVIKQIDVLLIIFRLL